MGKSILSVDLVSVGLIASDGNIDMNLKELSDKVIENKILRDFCYWQTENDYFDLLTDLVFFHSQIGVNLYHNNANCLDIEIVNQLKFREIVPEMLKFSMGYLTDTEDGWIKKIDNLNLYNYNFFYLDKARFDKKMQIEEAMMEFFKNAQTCPIDVEEVKEFMLQHSINIEEINKILVRQNY
jgi:hypothetical protein